VSNNRGKRQIAPTLVGAALALAAVGVSVTPAAAQKAKPFLSTLKKATQIGSTVPANSDVNPYGVAVVPETSGSLVTGDTLVSNFNDKANAQGTGTTIVELAPNGDQTPFANLATLPSMLGCPGGVGLTTALATLPDNFVVVGSLPAGPGGALPNANPAGCLIVLNSTGVPVATWSNADINGPWDMTEVATPNGADLFVANVLSRPPSVGSTTTTPKSGLCDIVRIDVSTSGAAPTMGGATVIGTGFPWKANKAAFVQGPTGVALGHNGTLYVAETIGSTITPITNALSRTSSVSFSSATITAKGLNGPLGLVTAPNGDLLAFNGNDGNVVEISPSGRQVAKRTLIHNGAGDLFGAAITANGKGILFVNDGTNALDQAVQR
jgi:hypothetical protein